MNESQYTYIQSPVIYKFPSDKFISKRQSATKQGLFSNSIGKDNSTYLINRRNTTQPNNGFGLYTSRNYSKTNITLKDSMAQYNAKQPLKTIQNQAVRENKLPQIRSSKNSNSPSSEYGRRDYIYCNRHVSQIQTSLSPKTYKKSIQYQKSPIYPSNQLISPPVLQLNRFRMGQNINEKQQQLKNSQLFAANHHIPLQISQDYPINISQSGNYGLNSTKNQPVHIYNNKSLQLSVVNHQNNIYKAQIQVLQKQIQQLNIQKQDWIRCKKRNQILQRQYTILQQQLNNSKLKIQQLRNQKHKQQQQNKNQYQKQQLIKSQVKNFDLKMLNRSRSGIIGQIKPFQTIQYQPNFYNTMNQQWNNSNRYENQKSKILQSEKLRSLQIQIKSLQSGKIRSLQIQIQKLKSLQSEKIRSLQNEKIRSLQNENMKFKQKLSSQKAQKMLQMHQLQQQINRLTLKIQSLLVEKQNNSKNFKTLKYQQQKQCQQLKSKQSQLGQALRKMGSEITNLRQDKMEVIQQKMKFKRKYQQSIKQLQKLQKKYISIKAQNELNLQKQKLRQRQTNFNNQKMQQNQLKSKETKQQILNLKIKNQQLNRIKNQFQLRIKLLEQELSKKKNQNQILIKQREQKWQQQMLTNQLTLQQSQQIKKLELQVQNIKNTLIQKDIIINQMQVKHSQQLLCLQNLLNKQKQSYSLGLFHLAKNKQVELKRKQKEIENLLINLVELNDIKNQNYKLIQKNKKNYQCTQTVRHLWDVKQTEYNNLMNLLQHINYINTNNNTNINTKIKNSHIINQQNISFARQTSQMFDQSKIENSLMSQSSFSKNIYRKSLQSRLQPKIQKQKTSDDL